MISNLSCFAVFIVRMYVRLLPPSWALARIRFLLSTSLSLSLLYDLGVWEYWNMHRSLPPQVMTWLDPAVKRMLAT